MKRMHVVGLCLVAAFVLSGVVTAVASAELPEYRTCAKVSKGEDKKFHGKYSTKQCATEATLAEQEEGKHNKYERKAWNEGKSATPGFKGKNEGAPHNNLVDPICPTGKFNNTSHKCEVEEGSATASEAADIAGTTTCTKEKLEGKVTGPKTTAWKTTYGKCEALESACNTKGEKAGTIVTDELVATLVYLKAPSEHVPGIEVVGNGAVEHNGTKRLAQYECLGGVLNVEVFGAVLAKDEGNTNSAEKGTVASVEEGPLKLQSDLYVEASHTEEFAKATFIWGHNFLKCVEEWMGKGKTQEEAEFNCFSGAEGPPFVGPYPGYPEPGPDLPVMLESVTSLGTAPAVQNGKTKNKGEKEMMIEA